MHTHLSRADLLDSGPKYDKHRDGPDAFKLGTRTTMRPYAGTTRIGTDEFSRDREMFLMRTDDTHVPAWMRAVKENARERVALHAGLWDWDCHKCETSVMTPELSDVCPNCLL